MQISVSKKTKKNIILLLLTGGAAGFLNGLLGAGGGILLVYALSYLNSDKSPEGIRDNFAGTVACILPITALSLFFYSLDGRMDIGTLSPLVLPAILGGICGALLLDRINTTWLKKIFSLLVIYSGVSMILR